MADNNGAERLVLLVVDDDENTRRELGRILKRHTGFEVLTAAGPSETLVLAAESVPDLALIDLRLPVMDGLSLLKRLRKDVAPNLMAIIMTGYGESDAAKKAHESGALDFVEKPLDLSYLLVVLRQMARESRLRKNLKAAAKLFAGVVDMLPDGIVMTDNKETPLFSNNLGRKLMDAGFSKPGERYTVEDKVYVLERTGSKNRFLWHWTDLTTALERERLSTYKKLARHLAHEIRNPLTPMRLWLQELQSMSPVDPNYAESSARAIGVLSEQVNRLISLLEQFRILGEGKALAREEIEVAPIIREVARALAPIAESKKVLVELPEGNWRAVGEENGLYRCLFNGLRNALEAYGAGGGSVTITVGRTDGSLIIGIADDAGGLPPEVAQSPFTPYLTTKAGGTGLGLLVSRDIAERMGGSLSLENRAGEGVVLRLELPCA